MVVVGASTVSYPHADSLTGQTAGKVTAGVRSLELVDDTGGRFSLFTAPTAASVSWDDGASTLLGSVPPGEIRPGKYVKARLVQDWSRFEVPATRHTGTTAAPGTLRVLQITSDGVSLDGTSYQAGDYEHEHETASATERFEGVAPIPDHSTTAEAEAFVEDGTWAVYFPVSLELSLQSAGTVRIIANMDGAFRWSDLPSAGYADGVYDIAPPLYEVVEQFGANRFDVTWTP
jgi:hypothetical protein